MRVLSLAFVAVLLLAGCVPQHAAEPTPTPTPTPVFASEEEALAAAEEAYAKYVAASDEVARQGGSNPEPLKELVSEEWFELEQRGFERFQRMGWFQVGATVTSNATLEYFTNDEVSVLICIDVSDVRFVDRSGDDVTPLERPSRVTMEVLLETGRGGLLLANNEPWTSNSQC